MENMNEEVEFKPITELSSEEVEHHKEEFNEKQNEVLIPFLHRGDKGKPAGTKENLEQLLDHYAITVRYNELKKRTQIEIPNSKYHEDIANNAKLAEITSEAVKHRLPTTHIGDYINAIAAEEKNCFHPVRDWINSAEWDGVDRLQTFYASVVPEGVNPLKERLMYKWALSAVAALYFKGAIQIEGVLTFQGKQKVGKTTWILKLIPPEYHNVWNKNGMVLDTKNKDIILDAVRHWIVELGELEATFTKSDITALKGFLTQGVDTIRPPYAETENNYKRQTVFYATCNDPEFLRDDQNRRFWTIGVKEFNWPDEWNAQQFWAQMKVQFDQIAPLMTNINLNDKQREYGWTLTPEENQILNEIQEVYNTVDPIDEMLSDRLLEKDKIMNGEWMNATKILNGCGFQRPSKAECNRASKWLKKMGYEQGRQKQYLVEFSGSALFEANRDIVKTIDNDDLRKKRFQVKTAL